MLKGRRPRIRCPLCGFLAWASCFEKEHDIEVKMQYTKGGRAKRDFVSYYDVKDMQSLEDVRKYLIECCKYALTKLSSTIIEGTAPTDLDKADRLEIRDELIKSIAQRIARLRRG